MHPSPYISFKADGTPNPKTDDHRLLLDQLFETATIVVHHDVKKLGFTKSFVKGDELWLKTGMDDYYVISSTSHTVRVASKDHTLQASPHNLSSNFIREVIRGLTKILSDQITAT